MSYAEVLEQFPEDCKHWEGVECVEQGMILVLIVQDSKGIYHVFNKHPLRRKYQEVYTLTKCNPEQQIEESLSAVKRLFEKN